MLELTYTVQQNHLIQLPDNVPVGTKVRLTFEDAGEWWQKPQADVAHTGKKCSITEMLAWMEAQHQKHTSFSSLKEIEAIIQENRDSWND